MRYDFLKIVNSKLKKVWILLLNECKDFSIIFWHNMTRFYLKIQMKSLKDFKCGWIITNVDIKRGENSQIFDEITIKASPPIWTSRLLDQLCPEGRVGEKLYQFNWCFLQWILSPHTPNWSPRQDLSFTCSLPFRDFWRRPLALRDQWTVLLKFFFFLLALDFSSSQVSHSTAKSKVCCVKCAVCSMQCARCSVQCAVCNEPCAVGSEQWSDVVILVLGNMCIL